MRNRYAVTVTVVVIADTPADACAAVDKRLDVATEARPDENFKAIREIAAQYTDEWNRDSQSVI